MRKALLWLIVVIIIVCALPFGTGILAKHDIEKILHSVSQGSPIVLTVNQYHRGWLSSKAEIQVHFVDPQMEESYKRLLKKLGQSDATAANGAFVIKEDIQHGPVLWVHKSDDQKAHMYLGRAAIYSRIVFSPEISANLTKALGQTPLIHGSTLISFSGKHTSTLEAQPLTYSDKSRGITVKWNGFRSNVHVSADLNSVDDVMKILSTSITAKDFTMNLGEINLDNNMTRDPKYDFWSGVGNMDLSSFDVQENDKRINIQSIKLGTHQNLNNDLLNFGFNLAIQKVSVLNVDYGPANFDFSMRNLDAAVWLDLEKMVQDINKQTNLSTNERRALYMTLTPHMLKLVSKGAEMEISKCDVMTPDGQFTMHAKVTLPNAAAATTKSPMGLLHDAKAELNMQIPITLLNKILLEDAMRNIAKNTKTSDTSAQAKSAQEIQILAQQTVQQEISRLQNYGVIVQDHSNYKVEATYSAGKVTLNGRTIPVPGVS